MDCGDPSDTTSKHAAETRPARSPIPPRHAGSASGQFVAGFRQAESRTSKTVRGLSHCSYPSIPRLMRKVLRRGVAGLTELEPTTPSFGAAVKMALTQGGRHNHADVMSALLYTRHFVYVAVRRARRAGHQIGAARYGILRMPCVPPVRLRRERKPSIPLPPPPSSAWLHSQPQPPYPTNWAPAYVQKDKPHRR